MIDLIKEIELKKINIESYHNEKYADGFIDGVNEVLEVINQYNIITAPKTIKLSEILDRLNKEHKQIINGNVVYEYKINRNGWYNEDGSPYYISNISIDSYHYGLKIITAISFNKKMNIKFIDFGDKHKWLYTLWIAGTIIEDDLKEE